MLEVHMYSLCKCHTIQETSSVDLRLLNQENDKTFWPCMFTAGMPDHPLEQHRKYRTSIADQTCTVFYKVFDLIIVFHLLPVWLGREP